jgi:glutamyl-tRNA(Gln) amidotransferase subunit E
VSDAPDYAALGFKAGLEIHQQLDTRKLFCRCPSRLDETEDADVRFRRTLQPKMSELGEVDAAVAAEAKKNLQFEYLGSRGTCCLVEMDEEPPHAVTPEALDAALEIALLLDAKPVDELHVMRKLVIDGSNTSGFQRTSLVATMGAVAGDEGAVRIGTLCLEEDSSRRLDRTGNVQRYRLDRLGIPLVEIATEPDLKGPQHAREIAEAIGLALRMTGKVKRGLGTIRQDLNVSIREGARVEIKGVQDLRLIPLAVEWEVRRQVHLLEVRAELEARGAKEGDYLRPAVDVTDAFASTSAKSVAGALKQGHRVLAVALPHLAGLLGKKGKEETPPPRVGRELADYAKTRAGVKGIFHSDELPAYGISAEECGLVASRLDLGALDAYALVVERGDVAEAALRAVLDRAVMLLRGVPKETRDLNPDGTSRYLRPLPGGARMYPETDVPPVPLDDAKLAAIRAALPPPPAEQVAQLRAEFPSLKPEQAKALVREGEAAAFRALVAAHGALSLEEAVALVAGGQRARFERLAAGSGLPKESARMLLAVEPALPAGTPEPARDAAMEAVLRAVAAGEFAKEAMENVVKRMLEKSEDVAAAAKALGLGAVDRAALVADIDAAIAKDAALVEKQGERASGPLMGPIMAKYRGQVSGKELSDLLRERIQKFLAARAG